jgi:hypothetical protein
LFYKRRVFRYTYNCVSIPENASKNLPFFKIHSGELEMSRKEILISLMFVVGLVSSCAVSAKSEVVDKPLVQVESIAKTETNEMPIVTEAKTVASKSTIMIMPNTPADTVRSFYKAIREKKFRDAMLMTNLGSAVEGLSPEEVEDLRPYFEQIAVVTPEDIEINGEQLSGNVATVFAKLPDENDKLTMTELNLRKEKDSWLLLLADEKTEADAKKQGKNYLFNLRITIHHSEVEGMFERISKAQFVAAQTKGEYCDMQTLVKNGFLPIDIQTTESTGYKFSITVSADKKKYFATAEPEIYGKSGKLSYFLEFDGKKSNLKSDDNKGMPIKK